MLLFVRDIALSFLWQQIASTFFEHIQFDLGTERTPRVCDRCFRSPHWHHVTIWILSFSVVYASGMPMMMMSIERSLSLFSKLIPKVMTNCSDNCNAPTINILYTHLRLFTTVTFISDSFLFSLFLNLNVKIGVVCRYPLICPSPSAFCCHVECSSAVGVSRYPFLIFQHSSNAILAWKICRRRCPFSPHVI